MTKEEYKKGGQPSLNHFYEKLLLLKYLMNTKTGADLAAQRDVFAEFNQNVTDFCRGNVEVHRMGWREYFAQDRGPIRFLHIDAEHTYREVFDNIEAALPLMVAGGAG